MIRIESNTDQTFKIDGINYQRGAYDYVEPIERVGDVNLPFDQLIWEFGDDVRPSWVHVSFRSVEENRGQVLVAYKDELGKTKYKPFE